MAGRWRRSGLSSVFVYTREAHPGAGAPPHASMADKLALARRAREAWGLSRPVLVDDLQGTVHRAYGCLPNMSIAVGRGGLLVYKASWTDPDHLDLLARRLIEEADAPGGGRRRIPFHVEWAPRRLRDDVAFIEGLAAIGPGAVEEYLSAMEANHGTASVRRMRQWWSDQRR